MDTVERNNQPSHDRDLRLYLPQTEGWDAVIKKGGPTSDYCHSKNPGEDYFHLILRGEIYLQFGDEKYCLNCAFRRGVLTRDRLFWQHAPANDT